MFSALMLRCSFRSGHRIPHPELQATHAGGSLRVSARILQRSRKSHEVPEYTGQLKVVHAGSAIHVAVNHAVHGAKPCGVMHCLLQ